MRIRPPKLTSRGATACLALVLGCLASTRLVHAETSLSVNGAALLRPQIDAVPGTTFRFAPGEIRRELEHNAGTSDFLVALMSWISDNVDLPRMRSTPQVAFSPQDKIIALRSAGLVRWQSETSGVPMTGEASVVAIYEPAHQTIHLPQEWSGNTPEELSVLVHELVHHIQYVSASKYECPQAREEAAYKAQQKWLALSDHDLMRDFDLDPFTLLVRTRCFY